MYLQSGKVNFSYLRMHSGQSAYGVRNKNAGQKGGDRTLERVPLWAEAALPNSMERRSGSENHEVVSTLAEWSGAIKGKNFFYHKKGQYGASSFFILSPLSIACIFSVDMGRL